LLRSFENLTIFNFDNVPGNLFRGVKFGSTNTNTANSIRGAITIALPSQGNRRITSLLRWRGAERQKLFQEAELFLSNVPLTNDYFPKVNSVMEALYGDIEKLPKLGELGTRKPSEFPLFVPASPRYFIPALKNPVDRNSQHTLYFKNQKDRDKAYLLINSSLMYWWWRVRDGGMTLSQETLLTLPMPDFCIDYDLVNLLELSEVENKVYKKNAGASRENVKHPQDLIQKLNQLIIPEYADRLLESHSNSEFNQLKFLRH
jgi:hypothetical protein